MTLADEDVPAEDFSDVALASDDLDAHDDQDYNDDHHDHHDHGDNDDYGDLVIKH